MATKKMELEVDFIGGQGPLTADEEQEISEFINKRKNSSRQKSPVKNQTKSKKPKVVV